jgi:cell wall-associated NlpC family hydrolase
MSIGPADDQGEALARAAERLVGGPFRLHGRDPATGLDCVGLVAAALAAIGARPVTPSGYSLRNLTVSQWIHYAEQSGLVAAPGTVRAGDVLLIALSHCQHHLAIAVGATSVIHAHAGLRRIVRQPLEPAWCFAAKWRPAPLIES